MDTKIPQEELDALKTAEIDTQRENSETLERLLGNMMESTSNGKASLPAVANLLLTKSPRSTPSLLILMIGIAFLVGCLFGSSLGFYFGRSRASASSLGDSDPEMALLAQQIQCIYDTINATPPPKETIEPLPASDEWEKLMPIEKS